MSKVFSRLCSLSLSRRTLARVMAAVFFVSLIPLIVIAVYNYPADDDFGYRPARAPTAWVRHRFAWRRSQSAIWNQGRGYLCLLAGRLLSPTALYHGMYPHHL